MRAIKLALKTFLILALLTGVHSCKKMNTDFTIDRNDYGAGEIIQITNKSQKVATYKWTLKAANSTYYDRTYTEKDPLVRINPCAPDDNYSLILVGTKKNDVTSTTTRNFLVKSQHGFLNISSSQLQEGSEPIEVKADNEVIGKINPGSVLQLKIATGLRYLTTSTHKTITFNVVPNGTYSWNIDQ